LKKAVNTFAVLSIVICISWVTTGCGGRPTLTNLSAPELFEKGKQEYTNKKYIKALEYFQAIVYNYPGESIVDTAQYYLALTYFGAEEYELAQVEFNRLLLNYPSSVYFQHSVFMKAASFFEGTPSHYGLDQSKLKLAITQFEDFIIDYPEAELIDEARRYLLVARTRMAKKFYNSGVVYSRVRAFKAAKIYYQKVIDDYTDTEFAPLATYHIAETEYKLHNYETARTQFEGFYTVFSDNELADEARKHAAEAAFKSGEQAFENSEFVIARERLQEYLDAYPDHKNVNKAHELLAKIDAIPLTNTEGEDAGS
jgi:outer membrane assembly lipoprotein YfiO